MGASNSQKPKVSVITVCFNSESTIRDTLVSVLSQSYGNIEHVIVDGGSSDGTMDIVADYRVSPGPITSDPVKRLYDTITYGLETASGEIIGILNSDDFYESDDVVEAIMSTFQQDTSLDIVFGDVVFVQPENLDLVSRYYRASHFRPWKLGFGWMPPHPATFVRRSV